jgi:Flp pilus assembly protein TadG
MRYRPARGGRRGVAAAELALSLSLLAFIMVAATDFSRLFSAYLTITSCARNGALYGCLNSSHSTNTSAIQTAALNDAGSMSSTPTVSSTTGTDTDGNTFVAVTVTYPFTTLVSYPGITNSLTLTRTVKMRVAQNLPD